VRNFPHEAGNWATYAAIPVSMEPHSDFLDNLSSAFSSLNLHVVEDFHISLTKVLILKHHWINDLMSSMRNIFDTNTSFFLILEGLSVYVNEEKTRTFLSIDVTLGDGFLNEIVDQLDKCLSEWDLPSFYESRSFHSSLLWGPGDLYSEVSDRLKTLEAFLRQYRIEVRVEQAFCKTGNKIFSFPFQ